MWLPIHAGINVSVVVFYCGLVLVDFNSLAPGKFEWNFRYLIFQIISVSDGWVISCELALRWMSPDLTDDKSTLVQVMAWCRQATSHYLNQFWPRSPTPYGVTWPQWVNHILHGYISRIFLRLSFIFYLSLVPLYRIVHYQWSNRDKYGEVNPYSHNKTKRNKTECISYGIHYIQIKLLMLGINGEKPG